MRGGLWRRKNRSPIPFIRDRIPITQRPKEVYQRKEAGHWEADLMLFSKYGQALLVVHERYSRILLLMKLKTKEAHPIATKLKALFQSIADSQVKCNTENYASLNS